MATVGSRSRSPARRSERQAHELLDVVALASRLDEVLARRASLKVRDHGRGLGEQEHRRELDLLGVATHGIGVEGRQRGRRTREHGHGVRVAREGLEEGLDALVDRHVPRDAIGERGQLVLGGQLPVNQQVRDLEEGGLLGELLDGIAAVTQDPGVAVDVRDRAFARRGVHEAGIDRDQAGVAHERGDRDAVVAHGRALDAQFAGRAVHREPSVHDLCHSSSCQHRGSPGFVHSLPIVDEPASRRSDPFVRGSESDPHVLCTRGAVENAWRSDDAASGQPLQSLPAVLASRRP